jgi:class 3 adenylate cyclase
VLALLALLSARWGRNWFARLSRQPSIALRYPDRTVQVPRGWSVLEASRSHGIAHVSICGGRARCSTCRVRVVGAPGHIGEPGRDEQRTLERVRAPADVRLACQLRPHGDIEVTPLFAPLPNEGRPAPVGSFGRERDVAILFVDLRRWSGLSERQWPFDLAYVLDRYFATVGAAVRESGGVPNQFIGDSVMAIFGLETDLPTACRQALHATTLIAQRMDAWSEGFEAQFGQRLEFGMGLHAGRAAVGEVGYLETTTFTAIGEVVNTASRLQDHSKTAASRLVVSLFAAQQAGVADAMGAPETLTVRGRSEPLEVLYPQPAMIPLVVDESGAQTHSANHDAVSHCIPWQRRMSAVHTVIRRDFHHEHQATHRPLRRRLRHAGRSGCRTPKPTKACNRSPRRPAAPTCGAEAVAAAHSDNPYADGANSGPASVIASATSRAAVRAEAVAAAHSDNPYAEGASSGVAPVLASTVDRAAVRAAARAAARGDALPL